MLFVCNICNQFVYRKNNADLELFGKHARVLFYFTFNTSTIAKYRQLNTYSLISISSNKTNYTMIIFNFFYYNCTWKKIIHNMYDTFKIAISSKITPHIVYFRWYIILGKYFYFYIYHYYCSLIYWCLMEPAMLKHVTCAQKNICF